MDPPDSRYIGTDFLPSRDGFAFSNVWEDRPWRFHIGEKEFVIGLRGRCGGMAFASLDCHRAGVLAATIGDRRPESGTPLSRYIMRRQIESIVLGGGVNLVRFAVWTYRPTGTRIGAGAVTRHQELGRLLVAMVAHRPVPLGLIAAERFKGLGLNHQVVAYGVTRDEEGVSIRVYDPNHPLRDDVTLELSWEGVEPVVERVGGKEKHRWRALFVESYRPRTPALIEGVAYNHLQGGGSDDREDEE